uniref:Uncharacterized protein n=1 Tax=Arundo donax TaxID=35708 RepID=A0A0A8YBF6_ARUDO
MIFGLKMPVAGSSDTDAAFYHTRDQGFNGSQLSFDTNKPNNVSKSTSVAKIKVVCVASLECCAVCCKILLMLVFLLDKAGEEKASE